MQPKPGETVDNIELRFTRPGTIRGRLVDKSGQPIVRAAVYSIATDHRDDTDHHPTARSDGQGQFELRFVRRGRHRLTAQDPKKKLIAGNEEPPIFGIREGEILNVGDVTLLIRE